MTNAHPLIDLDRLRHIIGSLSEGVLLVDAHQSLLWANDAALRMHGVEDLTGLELLNSVERPEDWTDEHLEAAIGGIAQVHAISV